MKSTQVFTLGHSPDPDDAFMFYAMAENKIDLRDYRFDHRLEDIQTLNERARRGELDISAISIHAYPYVAKNYAILPWGAIIVRKHSTRLRKTTPKVFASRQARQAPNSGSFARAARFGVLRSATGRIRGGELDAAFDRPTPNEDVDARESLRSCVIAVPGKMTGAFLALQLFVGEFHYVVVPFDRIFDAANEGRADAGLIIHEGQLTATTTCRAEACLRLVGKNLYRRDKGGQVLRAGSASPCTSRARARDSFAHKA